MAAESSDSEVEFKINQDYATRYDKWREKEELQKLKDRYGDGNDVLSESSSSSESEDEYAEELNPEIEKEFLKTLSYLKSKNPVIYDKNTKFFKQDENTTKSKAKVKAKKEKPMYLKDYERQLILDKGGILTDEEEGKPERGTKYEVPLLPSYVEEQKQLKESFKKALAQVDDDHDFLTERKKTKEELDKEELDFLDWLKGQKTTVDDKKVKKDMKFLHDYWNNPKLDRQEAFLKDFILNKRYLDHEDTDRIPSYDEIVHDSEGLSDDEETLEKQANFEQKYNFRFEEPDPEFIKHYPRTMKDSLRREDDRRKKKREEVKERKRSERERKQDELKQLKAFKRKEILEKLEKLKEIAGDTQLNFDDNDLEGDFDPDAYDRKMKRMFDDEYYQMEGDEGKPEFPEDEDDDIVNWDKWQRPDDSVGYVKQNEGEEPHCEDPEFNMDADYDPSSEMLKEMLKSSRNKKKRRKSKFAELASKTKPVFNPDDKTFEEYLDEYYKLDYEDVVGDQPCRFKYRKVPANDFGLSLEEILVAKDKELNTWSSLKKTCQYRSKEDEAYDIQAFQKKAANLHVKKKVLRSVYEPKNEDDEDESQQIVTGGDVPAKKKKKKKKKKVGGSNAESVERTDQNEESVERTAQNEESGRGVSEIESNAALILSGKEKKKKSLHNIDDSRMSSDFNVAPKKKKSKFLEMVKDQTPDEIRTFNLISITKDTSEVPITSNKRKFVKGLDVPDNTTAGLKNITSLSKIEDEDQITSKKRKSSALGVIQDEASAKKMKLSKINVDKVKRKKKAKYDSPSESLYPSTSDVKKVKDSNDKQKSKLQSYSQKIKSRPSGTLFKKSARGAKKANSLQSTNSAPVSDERLRAYGINPKKFKKKQIWKNMQQ